MKKETSCKSETLLCLKAGIKLKAVECGVFGEILAISGIHVTDSYT